MISVVSTNAQRPVIVRFGYRSATDEALEKIFRLRSKFEEVPIDNLFKD